MEGTAAIAPSGPLAGLLVLEPGQDRAGPFCTRVLAGLGAEVVKLEPSGGDPFRGCGASMAGNSVRWSIHGRNELCAEVDLKRQEGKEAVRRLAARSDGPVENFRPGYLERLGLGPEALRASNPRLMAARSHGTARTGPTATGPASGRSARRWAGSGT